MTFFTPIIDKVSENFENNIYPFYSYYNTLFPKKSISKGSQITYLSRDNFDFSVDKSRGTKMTYRYARNIRRRPYRRVSRVYKPLTSTYPPYRRRYRKRYVRKSYRYTRKPTQTSLISNSGSSLQKYINRNRRNVGLPPMQINLKTTFYPLNTANQWIAFAANQFSRVFYPHEIGKAAGDLTQREGDTARILPFTFKLHLRQPRDNTVTYRVMVIKFMPKQPESMAIMALPENVLRETGSVTEAIYSPYLSLKDGRLDYPFKVLYDKRFEISSYGADNSIRHYNLKIPQANVIYDEDSVTGVVARNAIVICVLTQAATAAVDWYWGYEAQIRFIDIN